MSSALAGLTLLIIGDSHLVYPGSLITHLHDNMQQQGARVFTYSACGVPAGAWVEPRTVPCGTATRLGREPFRRNDARDARSWAVDELIQRHRPNFVLITIGDTMAAYPQRELSAGWVNEQVDALTSRMRANSMTCIWVGPTWGTEGGPFFKNFGRVRELNEILSSRVEPCAYVDSLAFSRPGEWPTYDGQHHTADGYRRWAQAITRDILSMPGIPILRQQAQEQRSQAQPGQAQPPQPQQPPRR